MITDLILFFLKLSTSVAYASDEANLLAFMHRWLYGFLIPAGTVLAGLVILFGGIMYAQSGGDPGKTGLAKEYIIGAITGLALLMTAVLIIRTITGK